MVKRLLQRLKKEIELYSSEYAGSEVKRGDETYLILNVEDLLAIIED